VRTPNRVVFGSALLLATQVAATAWAQAAAGSEPLTLRVLSFAGDAASSDASKTGSIWLAVTNTGKSAQLLCLAGRGYTVLTSASGSVATADTSPHECNAAESFRLVPAGDTSYWYMEVALPARPKDTEIMVGATLFAKPLHTNQQSRHHIQWSGTIADTAKEGKGIR
jgi:hypothetical protein